MVIGCEDCAKSMSYWPPFANTQQAKGCCQPDTGLDREPEDPAENVARVLLIVEAGSVVSKPDYVDLVEIKRHAAAPIVVREIREIF